jgi:hypothetical protein
MRAIVIVISAGMVFSALVFSAVVADGGELAAFEGKSLFEEEL